MLAELDIWTQFPNSKQEIDVQNASPTSTCERKTTSKLSLNYRHTQFNTILRLHI